MSAKRALIVDDSRSARSFLARILEKYEIEVDTAETAELAIEYLSKSRPDVIFMDHMMPGMDGFQAVQSIKNNPTTAMIPIMMYTSQEGELYLGQARALGAVGVLPKQIKPTEVSTVLHQLHLVPDRRQGRLSAFTPVNEAAVEATRKAAPTLLPVESPTPVGAAESTAAVASTAATDLAAIADLRQQLESFVRAELGDFRRSISASLDMQSERLLGDVRAAVTDLVPQQPPPPPLPEPVPPSRAPWFVAAAASIAAAAFAVLWWREAAQTQVLATRLVEGRVSAAQLAADRNAAAARSASMTAAAAADSAAPGQPAEAAGLLAASVQTAAARRPDSQILQLVPYGEVPLSGERLEALRALLNSLLAQNFRGTVTVTSVPGRFCLAGSPADGYAPAADATPVAGCELVGNPFDESLTMSQREPLTLVNLIGAIRKQSEGRFEVNLVTGAESARAAAYPATTASATAGDWNRAALGNNRVEVRVRPEA